MEEEQVCANIDLGIVKQEPTDTFCDSKKCTFSNLEDKATYQEKAKHNKTDSGVSEDKTSFIEHKEVPVDGCKIETGQSASSEHDNSRPISERILSVNEIKTELGLTNENHQLHDIGTPVEHTQISGTSVGDPVGSTSCPEGIQARDTPHISDMCAPTVSVGTHSNSCKKTHAADEHYTHECCVSFTQSDCFTTHKETDTGEKPYKCNFCGAFFAHHHCFKNHKRTHTGEKPYKCDACSASFTRVQNLKSHLRTHTGEKPYKCDLCDASFRQVHRLKSHKRTHTGEKPYRCDFCDASFARSDHLTTHKKTHTGGKPYRCDLCDASFPLSGHLKLHKTAHTGEKAHEGDVFNA